MLKLPEMVDLDKKTKFAGRLVICPTPIGNLRDLTLRNYYALTEADIIVCEDTRHTGKLLKLIRERGIDTEMEIIAGKRESNGVKGTYIKTKQTEVICCA